MLAGVIVPVLLAQSANPSPQELLSGVRPLSSTEIAAVLNAAQRAIDGKTVRVASNGLGGGPVVLMGRGGVPRRIRFAGGVVVGGVVGGTATGSGEAARTTTTMSRIPMKLLDYTGRPARDCGSSSAQGGELVVEYTFDFSTEAWTATARRGDPRELGRLAMSQALEMLRGLVSVTSGERRRIRNRRARALVSPWTPPSVSSDLPRLIGDPTPNLRGDPAPSEAIQSLWIDSKSLLPLRWEVSERGVPKRGWDFNYSSIDLRPPSRVRAPDCIR